MKKEIQKKYLHLVLGYTGLLFVFVSLFKNISVTQNQSSYALTMFGLIFIISYFQYADRKMGASKKDMAFFRIGLIVILAIIIL
ncbi:hypothetical protein ACOJQI_10790 [Bacillus salacetis]|uniref:hypothetical protein n=1 Tax=Bacillus salacetis TaxID=2315464 RepID=UPI003BA18F8C